MQRQARRLLPRWPHGHGRIAFLPNTKLTRRCGKPKDYAEQPRTLAEHLKRARCTRKLYQRDVAALIGVGTATVANWEKGKTKPPVVCMPAVIRFLGFDPTHSPDSKMSRVTESSPLGGADDFLDYFKG